MAGTTRGIEQTPVRIDTAVATTRQTPKADFGAKVLDGAGTVANTVAMAAPLFPGGAIVSAAVTGVSSIGGSSPALGVGGWSGSGTATTPSTGTPSTGTPSTGTPSTTTAGTTPPGSIPAGSSSNAFGVPGSNVDLTAFMNNNMEMLKLQMYMQNENQRFSTWSNVLRVRHDTTKNAISNIR